MRELRKQAGGLNYEADRGGGRLLKAIRRPWLLGLCLMLLLFTAYIGPRAWSHYRLMQAQSACMATELPADRPLIECDPARAKALVSRWPTEYRLVGPGVGVRVDPRWETLARELALPSPSRSPHATMFLGERISPNGNRRLVVVEDVTGVTVIEPAAPLRAARVLNTDAGRDSTGSMLGMSTHTVNVELALAAYFNPEVRIVSAVRDPINRSLWTVPVYLRGVRRTWEYQLHDDDTVLVRFVDLEHFNAAVRNAAK